MTINKYEVTGADAPYARRTIIELKKWWNLSLTAYYNYPKKVYYYSLIFRKKKYIGSKLFKMRKCSSIYNPTKQTWEYA